MLPNVMSGLRAAESWLMTGRGHVSSARGDGARGPGPATAPPAAVVLAPARYAHVTHCVRARRPRLRPGPDRLGTGRHPDQRPRHAAVRLPAGGRGDLHRGAAPAGPADRRVAGPALRVVAAHRAAATAVVRAARPVRHRRRAVRAGPADAALPPAVQLGRPRAGR